MRKKVIIASIVLLALIGTTIFVNASYSLNEEDNSIKENLVMKLDNITNVEAIETASIINNPIIEDNRIEGATFSLNNPGDYITFDLNIKNQSKTEAKIAKINYNSLICNGAYEREELDELCKNISIDITYKNTNKEVKENDIIFGNSINPINVTIIYNNGPNVKEDVNITLDNPQIEFVFTENN